MQRRIQTSTPTRRSTICSSPSVSSVGACSSTSSNGRGRTDNDYSISELFDESVPIEIVTRGKLWQLYKPLKTSGLYYALLTSPGNYMALAYDAMQKFRAGFHNSHLHECMIELMQFFVDVAGYQHVNVGEWYTTSDLSFEYIIQKLDEHPSDNIDKNEYLLRNRTEWLINVHTLIFYFVRSIVHYDLDGLLYRYNHPKNIQAFLKAMASSNLRSVAHTGSVLAFKMLTEYYKALKDYMESEDYHGDAIDKEQYIAVLTNSMKYLFPIFRKSCSCADEKMWNIRLECTKEMLVWFKINIEHIKYGVCLDKLCVLIVHDPCVEVRRAAAATCLKMFELNYLKSSLEPFIGNLIEKALYCSLRDKDDNVSIISIRACYSILDMYPQINDTHQQLIMHIMSLVLFPSYPRAQAAGEFVTNYVRFFEGNFITNIFKLCTPFVRALPLVVEAILDSTPELNNPSALVEALLNLDSKSPNSWHVLEFIHQIILQTVTGVSPYGRKKSRIGIVSEAQNNAIAKELLPNMPQLLHEYKTNKGLKSLIEILSIFNYPNVPDLEKEMGLKITNELFNIFLQNKNDKLIKATVSMIALFCEVTTPWKAESIQFFSKLKERLLFLMASENMNETEMESLWAKLNVLMSKMDFTEDLDFSEIYNEQYLSFPKILRHQLSCCTWYLIWDWRKSIKHGHNQNMLKGFHDYISYLERYLDNRNDEVVREVVIAMCDVYQHFYDNMKEYLGEERSNEEMNNIMKYDLFEKFISAFVSSILTNQDANLELRRSTLASVFSLMLHKIIPLVPAKILKFYDLHYKEFGDLMTAALQTLKQYGHTEFCILVLNAVVALYWDFNIKQHEQFSEEHADCKHLKDLVKRFQKKVIINPVQTKIMVDLAVQFVCGKPDNVSFLYFLNPLIHGLEGAYCRGKFAELRDNIPEIYHQNGGFISFMRLLKSNASRR